MTLEELLRAAAEKGLTHLTVYPVHSHDRKTVIWAARANPSTNHSFVHAEDLDVVKAVTTVLDNLPSAKRRTQKKITVTVNPHEPTLDDFLPKP